MMKKRRKESVRGAPIMSSEALRQLRFSTLLTFANASKEIHITMLVSLGSRIGPSDISVSISVFISVSGFIMLKTKSIALMLLLQSVTK